MGARGFAGVTLGALMAMSTAALAMPPGPAPQQGPVFPPGVPWYPGFPPAAWLETQGGDYWLQTGEFSWCAPRPTALIAPPGAPPGAGIPAGAIVCVGPPVASLVPGGGCQIDLSGRPEIRLVPGEVARVHLAFEPTSLVLALGRTVSALAPSAGAELPPAAETGGAILEVGGPWGSRVRYLTRIVTTSDAEPPSVGAVRASRDGARVRLRLRLSEPADVRGCVEPVLRRGEFVGARTLPLFRTLRADSSVGGQVVLGLGDLPARRYRISLRLRDQDGNSTFTSRVITVPGVGAGR